MGWNQKDFPSLHGKFHIGDQLISICNIKITSAAMAHKMLRHPSVDPVEMLVKRTPYAKVLAIRRVAEGQNIGIKRNGGTAEVSKRTSAVRETEGQLKRGNWGQNNSIKRNRGTAEVKE